MEFSELLKNINSLTGDYPPVHLWNPELCEGVSMRIDREGHWYYQDSIIGREKLKILFSRILKKEGECYYLVTPAEKVLVNVDLAPYKIIDFEVNEMEDEIIFKTNLDYDFPLDSTHLLEMRALDGEEIPFINARNDLEAYVSRPVFYRLIELALRQNIKDESKLLLKSFGKQFSLGEKS